MKGCPQCGREYDNTMSFCLDDGSELLYGPTSMSEPTTAILSKPPASAGGQFDGEAATRPQMQIDSARSIAVLPFAHLSSDPDDEYFCDGLAEELLNALARIDGLKVAARTSAFSFKGTNTNVGEIGKVLNVSTVLEGSVRKSGNRLRITSQLVNAADGYHLWSERYDREMKDIFDVQDEITLAVVEALKVKLFGDEKAAVLKRYTRNAEAHEFYLRGLAYFVKWTPEFFQKAIESFERAIKIDPDYASAYAGLAEACAEMSFSTAGDWMPKARGAARKALELDDTLGEAHNSLAVIRMYYDWDHVGAESEFKRAIALSPGNAHIRMWYGWHLGLMGRFDESLEELKSAQELDPLSPMVGFAVGAIYYWSRQYERAIEQQSRVIELNPHLRVSYWFLADAYTETGDFASAVATIEKGPKVSDHLTQSAAAYAYAKSGERQKALELLAELERDSGRNFEPSVQIAQIYLGLGDIDQAFSRLEKAFDARSVWLIWLGVDPKFDALRPDQRFKDLIRRIGLPE